MRHRVVLFAGLALGLIGSAASLAQPLAIGQLISSAEVRSGLLGPIAFMVALFCADAAGSAAQAYLIGLAGESTVFDIRRLLVGRLLHSDLAAVARYRQGDLFTRMVTDTSLAKVALVQSGTQLIVNGLMVFGGVVVMIFIDGWLMLVTVACLGIASAFSMLLARRLRRVSVRNREDTGNFGADLQRAVSALATVKVSRAEVREQRRIVGLAAQAHRSGVRVGALNALLTPTMNVGLQASLAVVVCVGMSRIASGSLALPELTSFVMYLFYLVSPLVLVFTSIGQFQQGRAAIQRVDDLTAIPKEEAAPLEGPTADLDDNARQRDVVSLARTVTWGQPAVEFRDVWFSYDDRPVLRGVSCRVPVRGVTAVVGPSGAGKSTLFQLIERFHRVDAGTVLINGENVEALPLEVLRGLVGYVQQDSIAMSGTVRENLTYANPSAAESDIQQALELAGLEDTVDTLPRGLQTPLGERGSGLSGGERQRLCIARTLLQRPAVLLLDEVTSQLDSDSELAFRRVLERISRQCAVVAIAHRMSTVVAADQIVVLSDGAIEDIGAHEELMVRDPLYRRLAGSQFGEDHNAVRRGETGMVWSSVSNGAFR